MSDILMIFNEVLDMSNSKNYALLLQNMITVLVKIIFLKAIVPSESTLYNILITKPHSSIFQPFLRPTDRGTDILAR